MKNKGGAVSSRIESADATELQNSDSGTPVQERADDVPMPVRVQRGARALKAGLRSIVVLCVATTLVHVVLVFLHVAPANTVSKRYSPLINTWVYPFFEQNWRLFAPDPESVNRRILARTAHTGADGSTQVSAWVDLTAVDESAVEHDVFPSHTAQNMLRRSWSSYVDTHGTDDKAHTDRALMMQNYLSNIAADRVAARNGGTFEFIQLRVLTMPIAASDAAVDAPSTPVETRLLPWWKVSHHGK